MNGSGSEILTEEEKLVAELDLLGSRYLSRQTHYRSDKIRSPEALLADLVRQPSVRVRAAVIAVSLSHPEYAAAVPSYCWTIRMVVVTGITCHSRGRYRWSRGDQRRIS